MSNASRAVEEAAAGISTTVAVILKTQGHDFAWLSEVVGISDIRHHLESEHVPWLTVVKVAAALKVSLSDLIAEERPVDVDYLAEYLGKSPFTIRRYAADGDLPAFKSGREWRFFLSEVRKHLTERAIDPWALSKKPRGRGARNSK